MAYTKTTWVDGGAPAINADNLNKIETGIEQAHQNASNVTITEGTIDSAEIGGTTPAKITGETIVNKGPAAVSGAGNLSTVASSTTVTLPAADYTAILEGATLVANALTRYVTSKDGSNQVTIDTATDWSTGYTFTRQNPISQFLDSAGGIKGWARADGVSYWVGNASIGTMSPYESKLHIVGAVRLEAAGRALHFENPGVENLKGKWSGTTFLWTNTDQAGSLDDNVVMAWDVLNSNVGLNTTTFGTSAVTVLAIAAGTAPTSSPADISQLWVADIAAGNAALHTRTESGAVIKLYQQSLISDPTGGTTTDAEARTAINSILDILENNGLMANA